jgi:hypothetical protein
VAAPPVGEAVRLRADVIDHYTQTMKRPPPRLVSRRSRFFPEELTGFQDALSSYEYDLVALAPLAGPLAMDLSRSGQRGGCRRGYRQPQDAVPLAACGACCTPWEGSLIAYVYRVSAAGAAAARAGSLRGPVRR